MAPAVDMGGKGAAGGGGGRGQVVCLAALRGEVNTLLQLDTDGRVLFVGDGWGAAGIGFSCDPGTWRDVPSSRRDDWCATGDAQFSAKYRDGDWEIPSPEVDAVF